MLDLPARNSAFRIHHSAFAVLHRPPPSSTVFHRPLLLAQALREWWAFRGPMFFGHVAKIAVLQPLLAGRP